MACAAGGVAFESTRIKNEIFRRSLSHFAAGFFFII